MKTLIFLLMILPTGNPQYSSPIVEEWVDCVYYTRVDNDERLHFFKGGKSIHCQYLRRHSANVLLEEDEQSKYFLWYDKYGRSWVKTKERQDDGAFGKWVQTGILHKVRFTDFYYTIETTEVTKLEKLLGVTSVYYKYPKIEFGKGLKTPNIDESELSKLENAN